MNDPSFRLGMTFSDAKDESRRISARCSDECPWRIFASATSPDDPTIIVKNLLLKNILIVCLFMLTKM